MSAITPILLWLKERPKTSIFIALILVLTINNSIDQSKLKTLAEAGGFDSVSEYGVANRLGYTTKAEYSSFLDAERERERAAMKAGGFIDADEYNAAIRAGMPTKELYDKYVIQQASLKLAEDKLQIEQVAQKSIEANRMTQDAAEQVRAANQQLREDEAELARQADIAGQQRLKSDFAELVTQTRWGLGYAECNLDSKPNYRRFTSEGTWMVIYGNSYRADDKAVNYKLSLDWESNTFQVGYQGFMSAAPRHPASITNIQGKILQDGSLQLKNTTQTIVTSSMNKPSAVYDTKTSESNVSACTSG